MNLPIKFPDDTEVIAAEAARFRALSPRDRIKAIRGLLAAGDLMMRNSPKAAFLRAYSLEQEELARQAVKEFLKRHGEQRDVLENELIVAVETLADVLTAHSIRYALIGGLATLMRGRPRFTQDVDILLEVPQMQLPNLLDELAQHGFTLDIATVIRQFVQEHFSAFHYGSIRIDWLKPMLPLYMRTLADASMLMWTDGHPLRVAQAEGLILTKMVAFRPQDQADIETLLIANRDEIDVTLIRDEWTAVATGEDARTVWLESAIARLVRSQD